MEVTPDDEQAPRSHHVMGDIEPFQSTVDGSIITGRKSLREHNRRNGVTSADDFKEQWKTQAKERERFFNGESSRDRSERVEALKYAFEKHRRR